MKKIVLVVEDLEDVIITTKKLLTEAGFGVVIATNLVDAKRLLGSVKISAVLTDMQFPQFEGKSAELPCGIWVATQALAMGLPTVVCSSDRHDVDYAVDAIKVVSEIVNAEIVINRYKDTAECVAEIKKMLKED